MNNVATGLVLIPGVVALLIFLVFSYLYEQSRQSYFRAWQLAWAAYTLHYALEAVGHFRGPSALLYFLSSLLLVAMAIYIFVSTRLMRGGPLQLNWYDGALADRKSTRLNSSHVEISYAVFCLKKKNK